MHKAWAVMAGMILFSVPARAHWENSKWGMTEAEVHGLGLAFPLGATDKAAKNAAGGPLLATLRSPYQSGEFTFDVIYMFDSAGHLAAVSLELLNSNLDALKSSLVAKYGTPGEDGGNLARWNTASDVITLSRVDRVTTLFYAPRTAAGSKVP